jgi:hypothetical protein
MKPKNNLLNKKLPSVLSIVLVSVSLVTISWLSGNIILFGTKAATANVPKNVQISNISDSSFTISYTTDEKVFGTIAYGKDKKLGGVGIDDRDQLIGKPVAHRVHHITVQGVNPSTTYYLSIASGAETFMNNKDFYHVTTAPPSLDQPSEQAPLAGKATLDDGSIPTEAIAYVKTDSSQLLSTVLKPDGSYLIPLNSMRKVDFSSYIAFSPMTKLDIQIISPTLQSSLSTLAGQANPVPLIILSKNYDFSLEDRFSAFSASDSATASDSASPADSPGLPDMVDTTLVTTPQITTPKEAQTFTDQQPRFSGKTVPNADVEIIINSGIEIKTTVQSDGYGNWSYRPSTPLDAGNHTITINSPDSEGLIQQITNSFTVYAEGGNFIEPSVLPSISPTARPTSIPRPTEQPTMQPTSLPTIAPSTNTSPTGPGNGGNGSGTGGNNGQGGTVTGSITPGNGQGGPTSPPIPRSGNEVVTIATFASVISLIIGGILFSLL